MRQIISEKITREFDENGRLTKETKETFYKEEVSEPKNHTGTEDYFYVATPHGLEWYDPLFIHPSDTCGTTTAKMPRPMESIFYTATSDAKTNCGQCGTQCSLESIWNGTCDCDCGISTTIQV